MVWYFNSERREKREDRPDLEVRQVTNTKRNPQGLVRKTEQGKLKTMRSVFILISKTI
jgi:hypothetical protein